MSMDKLAKLTELYKEEGSVLNNICKLNQLLNENKTKLAQLNIEIEKLEG